MLAPAADLFFRIAIPAGAIFPYRVHAIKGVLRNLLAQPTQMQEHGRRGNHDGIVPACSAVHHCLHLCACLLPATTCAEPELCSGSMRLGVRPAPFQLANIEGCIQPEAEVNMSKACHRRCLCFKLEAHALVRLQLLV